MAKFEIWRQEDRDELGKLIPVSEIEQKICTYGDGTVLRLDEEANPERIAELNRVFEEYKTENSDKWHKVGGREFLEDSELSFEIHDDDYYSPSNKIVFCQGEFCDESYFETFPVYTWWNGSNWKDEQRPDEYGSVEEVEFDEADENCLDTWNGSNYQSGGTGMHDYMVRLADGRILMIYRSQWQGDHTEASIFTDEEYAIYRRNRKLD